MKKVDIFNLLPSAREYYFYIVRDRKTLQVTVHSFSDLPEDPNVDIIAWHHDRQAAIQIGEAIPEYTPVFPEAVRQPLLLDMAMLDRTPPGGILASGIIPNSLEGLYMTDTRKGDMLKWIAKKGHGWNDWAIYIHWANASTIWILSNGDKVTNVEHIRKLTNCTDEVLNHYRR